MIKNGDVVVFGSVNYVYFGQTVESQVGDVTYSGDAMLLPLELVKRYDVEKLTVSSEEFLGHACLVPCQGLVKLPFEKHETEASFEFNKIEAYKVKQGRLETRTMTVFN